MSAAGALLILAGVWVIAQVLRGGIVQRIVGG